MGGGAHASRAQYERRLQVCISSQPITFESWAYDLSRKLLALDCEGYGYWKQASEMGMLQEDCRCQHIVSHWFMIGRDPEEEVVSPPHKMTVQCDGLHDSVCSHLFSEV